MTKQFVHDGTKVVCVAPAGGVTSGEGYVIGNGLFVIAEGDAAAGETFNGIRVGEHLLTRNASDVFVQGNLVWWDNSLKEVVNATATGVFPIGVAAEARSAAAGSIRVVLSGEVTIAAP